MNINEAKEYMFRLKHTETIKAFAEGKVIQLKLDGVWVDWTYPEFSKDKEYRVKPEPPKLVTIPFGPLDFYRLPKHVPLKRVLHNSKRVLMDSEYFIHIIRRCEVVFHRFEGSKMAYEIYSYEVLAKEFFYTNQQGELVPCHHIQLETPDEE